MFELGAYTFVALFNLGGFAWWIRFLFSNGPRVVWPIVFASGAILVASVAVATSQTFYTLDREHVVAAGQWLRPIVAGGLFLAGLAHFRWAQGRTEILAGGGQNDIHKE